MSQELPGVRLPSLEGLKVPKGHKVIKNEKRFLENAWIIPYDFSSQDGKYDNGLDMKAKAYCHGTAAGLSHLNQLGRCLIPDEWVKMDIILFFPGTTIEDSYGDQFCPYLSLEYSPKPHWSKGDWIRLNQRLNTRRGRVAMVQL